MLAVELIIEASLRRSDESIAQLLSLRLARVLRRIAGAFRAECLRDRWFAPCLALLACLTLGLQITGGAFTAEFDGHPDEAAHLVSGLLVYDYVTEWPHQNPIRWAEQYYLHYPKVAIGHWPPGFYMLEAVWWLFSRPSRVSSMVLNAVMCIWAAAVLYRLIRTLAPGWIAAPMACLMIVSPVTQMSFDLTAADLPGLLLSTLFIAALVRWIAAPSRKILVYLGFLLAAGFLVKGTAAFLLLAPLIAAIISRKWREILDGKLLVAAAGIVAVLVIAYRLGPAFLRTSLAPIEYIRVGHSHLVAAVGALTGYGFGALAVAGIFSALVLRSPMGLAATAVLLSTAAVSSLLREATEPRHYIVVLPAILLLATQLATWASAGSRLAWLLLIAAAALFPFHLYHQKPAGFAELRRQIRLPARMLVSSNASGEGAWIAEVALGEKRPASVVARASQILAVEDWDGAYYRLVATTPQAVARRLDELNLDTIVVDSRPGLLVLPHHALLKGVLQGSPAWRICAESGAIQAFCRVLEPTVPRVPLQIDLGRSIGRVITER